MLICVCIRRLLESWIGHSNFGIMTRSVELKNKTERLNPIGNNVYVIRYSDVDSELGKRTFEEAFGDTLDADLGFTVGVEEPAVIEAL
jgi:hypothetical protein